MFCFFRFKEIFSTKLSLTCSSLIKHTLVNKEKTFILFSDSSVSVPFRIWKLLVSILMLMVT